MARRKQKPIGPYQKLVSQLKDGRPDVRYTDQFLTHYRTPGLPNVFSLDVSSSGGIEPDAAFAIPTTLDLLTFINTPVASGVAGQLLLVEDVTSDLIECLGSALQLDPAIFANYLRDTRYEGQGSIGIPQKLASHSYHLSVLAVPYIRTLIFERDGLEDDGDRIMCAFNCRRVVAIGGRKEYQQVGLARAKFVSFKVSKGNGWLCVVLIDPVIAPGSRFRTYYNKLQDFKQMQLPKSVQYWNYPLSIARLKFRAPSTYKKGYGNSHLYQGGYIDFSTPSSGTHIYTTFPSKEGLLPDLLFYLQERAHLFAPHLGPDPSIAALSYFPLKIAASEWVVVIEYANAQVERVRDTEWAQFHSIHLERLESRLQALHTWKRRLNIYEDQVTTTLRSLSLSPSSALQQETVHDYENLQTQLHSLWKRVDGMIPMIINAIQIADSRKTLGETENMTRLTYVALVFVPLGVVTSAFGMNDVEPGKGLWRVWAVAGPIVLLVFLAALRGLRGGGPCGRGSSWGEV